MPREGNPPTKKTMENRAHPRVATSNLMSFVCLDAAGKPIHQGMGRALDVSTSGLMLESSDPIETDRVSLFSTDLDDSLIEIVGKVVYSRKSQTGSYKNGIQFIGSSSDNTRFAASLIKSFHYRRTRPLNGALHPKATND